MKTRKDPFLRKTGFLRKIKKLSDPIKTRIIQTFKKPKSNSYEG
jgi:hypothetical protein